MIIQSSSSGCSSRMLSRKPLVHRAVHRRAGRFAVGAPFARDVRSARVGDRLAAATRRHSRIALSARGNPANRYVCSTTSSTHSAGTSAAARASASRTLDSVPAATIAARRTSARVASSRSRKLSRGRRAASSIVVARHRFDCERRSGDEPNLADDLAARVAHRATAGTRRAAAAASLGKHVEMLQHANAPPGTARAARRPRP